MIMAVYTVTEMLKFPNIGKMAYQFSAEWDALHDRNFNVNKQM